ncbi:hypothetical protein GCM10023192_60260 [Amycolatopsis samaneae]
MRDGQAQRLVELAAAQCRGKLLRQLAGRTAGTVDDQGEVSVCCHRSSLHPNSVCAGREHRGTFTLAVPGNAADPRSGWLGAEPPPFRVPVAGRNGPFVRMAFLPGVTTLFTVVTTEWFAHIRAGGRPCQ